MTNDPDQSEFDDEPKPRPAETPVSKPVERTTSFVQFSGIAFQMLGTIGLGVWAGIKLDQYQHNPKPIWTIILSMVAIGASLYVFIRQLTRK